ncbi:MFS transporter [Asanoa iriomotensis]|uniref:Major facilitator superfamily (MFS) profile domain-containing protein n=1 Tax=Asanoa iriomotensis TaxID=234613 RepID=A0ABQ4BU69_9ACTN|nr:MFS transporter [Asanoa iriomotensis]GIF54074.1 hypothetical protein Air01nite_01690 [Asanoa iriomotensis]
MQPVTAPTRLLVAATGSRLADEAAAVAVALHVVARTGDAGLAGLVVAAFALPTLATGPVLGALLDRARRPRALFLANQLTLAGALTGILLLAGHAPAPALIGLGLLAGLTAPVLTGGFSALVPRLTTAGGLPRANAADAASYDVAGLGGPALVAVVASLADAGPALAATAALAAIALPLVARAPMPGPAAEPADREPLPTAVRDGLALLWRVRPLRAATAATTLGFAAQGLLPVGFPLLAIHFGHPAAHGAWFLTAMSAGSLAGALASARLLTRFAPIPVLAAALAVLGTSLAAVAAAPTLVVALTAATAGGVATGPMLAATLAVRQQSVPARRYGQVVATAASIKVGAFALGASVTGPVTAWLPPRGVLLLVGAAQLVALLPLATATAPRVAQMTR